MTREPTSNTNFKQEGFFKLGIMVVQIYLGFNLARAFELGLHAAIDEDQAHTSDFVTCVRYA